MQNFSVEPPDAAARGHARDILGNVNAITRALRAAGAQILFTQNQFDPENSGHPRSRPLATDDAFFAALREGLQPGAPGLPCTLSPRT